MLEVKNLTKIYDDGTVALRNVSFTVKDGEFLIIIGLSGSGKSTLLRCINRLIEPTEGQILWDGVDVTAAESGENRSHSYSYTYSYTPISSCQGSSTAVS